MSKFAVFAITITVLMLETLAVRTASAQAVPECERTGRPGAGTICCHSSDGKRNCRPWTKLKEEQESVAPMTSLTLAAFRTSDAKDRTFPQAAMKLAACDQTAARRCQMQVNGCYDTICKRASRDQVRSCQLGCQDRYKECKVNAGCGTL